MSGRFSQEVVSYFFEIIEHSYGKMFFEQFSSIRSWNCTKFLTDYRMVGHVLLVCKSPSLLKREVLKIF